MLLVIASAQGETTTRTSPVMHEFHQAMQIYASLSDTPYQRLIAAAPGLLFWWAASVLHLRRSPDITERRSCTANPFKRLRVWIHLS